MAEKKKRNEYTIQEMENLINDFHLNGFTIIGKKFTFNNKIIADLKKEIDNLFDFEDWRGGWEGKEEYMEDNKMLNNGARRLSNLINKSDVFLNLISIDIVNNFCQSIFKDGYHIGGVDAREPLKGFGEQSLHQDWFPTKNPLNVENVIGFVFLDKSNKQNGSLRVVPKTQSKKGWVSDYIEDTNLIHPEQRFINAESGDILMMNGSLWHSGSKNINGKRRRVIYIDYRSKNIPQLLNQKKYLSKTKINSLPDKLREILRVRDEDKILDHKTFTTGDYCRKNNIFWPKG